MLRIISLAFAIAQSTVNADDHDWEDDHDEEPSAWEFIFPDQVFFIHNLYLGCSRRKFFAEISRDRFKYRCYPFYSGFGCR